MICCLNVNLEKILVFQFHIQLIFKAFGFGVQLSMSLKFDKMYEYN